MKKKKSFDCVEMKNAIQERLRKESEGLDEEEIARRRQQWLATSDSTPAKWWRAVKAKQESKNA